MKRRAVLLTLALASSAARPPVAGRAAWATSRRRPARRRRGLGARRDDAHRTQPQRRAGPEPGGQADDPGRHRRAASYPLNGQLAIERPRNFKLDVYHIPASGRHRLERRRILVLGRDQGPQADKAIYYCNYDETEASPLAATFQPDWIMEAMGLRVIPEDETAEYHRHAGPKPEHSS